MTKQAATDAGIGRAVFATRLMLSLRAMSMSLLLGALPGFLLPYLVWRASATEQEIDVVRIGLVSAFADEKKPSRWEMRNAAGEYRVVEALLDNGRTATELRPAEVRKALSAEWGAYRTFVFFSILSLILPVVGYLIVWYALIRLGRTNMEDKRVRGADELITVSELNSMVKKREGTDWCSIH